MTKKPAPLPPRGGSYERQPDGSLKRADPAAVSAKAVPAPQKPAAKAAPKTEA